MSCTIQRLPKLAAWLPLLILPMTHASVPVTCTIAAVQIGGGLTKSLPLSEPEYVGGHVDVLCRSASGQPHSVEFALLEVDDDEVRAGKREAGPIQVELFSDGALRKALPNTASQATDFSVHAVIAGAGDSKVTIPFHGRVFLRSLTAAGSYNIGRHIGLVYRVRAPR